MAELPLEVGAPQQQREDGTPSFRNRRANCIESRCSLPFQEPNAVLLEILCICMHIFLILRRVSLSIYQLHMGLATEL